MQMNIDNSYTKNSLYLLLSGNYSWLNWLRLRSWLGIVVYNQDNQDDHFVFTILSDLLAMID